MNRFYHPSSLELKQKTNLSAKAAHHAVHVMRLKIQDKIVLFHNDLFDYTAIIKCINKKNVEVYVESRIKNITQPTVHFRLFQTLTTNEKMDWIIQKSVELGVGSIIPIYSERSLIKLHGDRAEKKLSHWQQIIISASEQSGRSKLPNITLPKKIDAYSNEDDIKRPHLKLMLSPGAHTSINSIQMQSPCTVDIMIGPEGGFTKQEIKDAVSNEFLPISLGPRILRTETAPLAILSLLQYKYGDFA